MTELWKDIAGFEGYYQISTLGNVRSLDRMIKNGENSTYLLRGEMKSLILKDTGYLHVGLYKDKKRKSKTIHRLVAEAFIPNPNHLKVVNHIDGNKLNNVYTNLEWCTHSDNLQHAWDNKLRHHTDNMKQATSKVGKQNQFAKSIPIYQVDSKTGDIIRFWMSKKKAKTNITDKLSSYIWELAKFNDQGFFIIIEGSDCSGKSTLINLLVNKYHLPVVKGSDFEIAQQGAEKMFDYMNDIFNSKEIVILDRSFISNLVYAPLFDANILTQEHVEHLLNKIKSKSFVVHLQGDEDVIIDRLNQRGDDYIKEENIKDIIAGYKDVTKKLEQHIDITHFNISTHSSHDVFIILSKILEQMGINENQQVERGL